MAVYSNSITLASVSDGQSGTTLYTWIRYSNGQSGTEHYLTDQPYSDTKKIGFAYNQESSTPSSDYSDYTWSDYIGADGVGIDSIIEQYYLSTDAINPPAEDASGWSNTPQTWQSGKYYWTRSEITWTDNTTTHTTAVLAVDINQINQNLVNLQSQVDGQIQTWYYEGTPTLNNAPANTWTTTTDKDKHIGDLYYDKDTGYAYRFMYDNSSSSYLWTKITDSDVTEALELAGSKSTVWVAQPTVPYYEGDLWVVTNQDGSKTVYYCTQERTTGNFNQSDWSVTATDDTVANAAANAATAITQTAITNITIEYLKNTDATDPTQGIITNWSSTVPTWENGTYIWSRTTTTINGASSTGSPVNITGAKGETGATGAAAPYITLSGPTNVIAYDRQTSTYTPNSSFTVTGTATNTSISSWTYSVNGGSYSSTLPTGLARSGNTITITPNNFTNKTVAIKATGGTVSDVYTITRIESGKNGTNGISITNTSETITYGNSSDASTQPSSWSSTPDPQEGKYLWTKTVVTYTYSNSTTSTTTSYSVAYIGTNGTNGDDGRGISSTTKEIKYAKSSNGTTAPTTSTDWKDSISATGIGQGEYLWTRTIVTYNYTSGDPTTTVSYSVSYWAEDGAPGDDAIEVILSNESHTLTANASGAISSYTGAYTDVQIFEGITDQSTNYSIKVNSVASGSTTINGITVTVGTRKVTVTSVASGFTNNVVPIDIYNSGGNKIATKNFTISVSKAGAGISSVTITYGYSTNGQDASTVTNWGNSIPSVPQGQYLWTRTVTTFTDGSASKTTYSVSRIGVDGNPAKVYSLEVDRSIIHKFVTYNSATSDDVVEFNADGFVFTGYKEENNTKTKINLNSNDYIIKLSLVHDSSMDTSSGDTDWDDAFTDLWGNNIISKTVPTGDSNAIIFNPTTIINTVSPSATLQHFINILKNNEPLFVLRLYTSSSTLANEKADPLTCQIRFGGSTEMAKFNVTATSINAAVESAKMSFNATGLQIDQGTFKIINSNDSQEESVKLSYSPSEGLYIRGNGVFTGDVYANNGEFTGIVHATDGQFKGYVEATDGKFTGKIIANDGNIGGFSIEDGYLQSTDNNEVHNIQLRGADGSIYAKNITLGTGAVIEQYIALGNAKITNPATNDGVILESGDIKLTQAGVLKLGTITVDGSQNKISSEPYWSITSTTATFNDIVASGKIISSVFEVNKTQAVGGAMVFKPSYKVISVSGSVVTLDTSEHGIKANDYIQTTGGTEAIIKVTSVSNENITLASAPGEINGLVHLGNITAPKTSLIIGINSEEKKLDGFLPARGIVISEMGLTNNTPNYNVKAFLGDLTSVGKIGYGLYSQNAFLTGSLVNQGSTNKYAGINTLDGATANKFTDPNLFDDSRIVFWAGADSDAATDIQDAKFQVTENGSIYAQQGRFDGAVISNSIVQGSEVRTAKIYGTGDSAALSLYDVGGGGILFKRQSDDQTFFKVTYDGFSIATSNTFQEFKKFIDCQVDSTTTVDFYGNKITGSQFKTDKLTIDTNTISRAGSQMAKITFSDNNITLQNNSGTFTVTDKVINSLDLKEQASFYLGLKMRWIKSTETGSNEYYDLMIE